MEGEDYMYNIMSQVRLGITLDLLGDFTLSGQFE